MDEQKTNVSVTKLIDQAINKFLGALAGKEIPEVKLVVADVLRLIDLRKQLATEEIREVRIRWVESEPAPFVINT